MAKVLNVYRGDGLNLYAYVKNNPIMWVDPSGYNGCPGKNPIDADDGLGDLDWTNTNKKGETAAEHIQKHTEVNYQREGHTVFNGDPQSMVEDAWSNRNLSETVVESSGANIYNIPYENAGKGAGFNNLGQQQDYITIVTMKDTSTVITAFPSTGNFRMDITEATSMFN